MCHSVFDILVEILICSSGHLQIKRGKSPFQKLRDERVKASYFTCPSSEESNTRNKSSILKKIYEKLMPSTNYHLQHVKD